MMGKDTNLSNLVAAARHYGQAYASNRKWQGMVVKLVEPEDSYEPVKGWQPSIRVEDTYL